MLNTFLKPQYIFGAAYIGFLILFCKYLDPKYNLTERLRENKKMYITNAIIGTVSIVFAAACAFQNWIDGAYIFSFIWLTCTIISGNHFLPF